MLAYYVEWHMRRKLAPLLFDDEDKEAALASRLSPVAKAPRSDNAKAKAASKITDDDQPVHSFRTLMADLGALRLNEVTAAANPNYVLTMTTRPTAIQQKKRWSCWERLSQGRNDPLYPVIDPAAENVCAGSMIYISTSKKLGLKIAAKVEQNRYFKDHIEPFVDGIRRA